MEEQNVVEADYAAITYTKPKGTMLFKATLIDGFPFRYDPDVVRISMLDKLSGGTIEGMACFIKHKGKVEIVPAFPPKKLSEYTVEEFEKAYNERRMLHQPDWADFYVTLRVGGVYSVAGEQRHLQGIKQVVARRDGRATLVNVYLLFGYVEKHRHGNK